LVEDVVLQRGLILPEDELKTVQTILTPLENEAYQFQIFSQGQKDNQDEPTWILHGSGKISSAKTDTIPLSIDLEKYLTECEQPIEITEYYQKYKQRGMDYGASFQGIQQLWKGSKQAVGKIKLSPELVEQATDYQLHPALLDAAFQVIGAAMEETDSDHTYLPVGIRKLRVYGRPNKELWAIVSMKGQTLESDITLLDEQRTVVAQIEGLRLMATTAQALLHSWQVDINDWLYEIDWQAQILDCNVESISTSETGSWLLFVPSLELGQQLSETLQQKEQETILVSPGLEYQQLNSQHYQINPTQPEQFSRLLQETSDIKVIVHLWSLTETKESLSWQDLETAQELGCASVLHLLQAIAKTQLKDFPVLWLVTQGTQTVWEESEVKQPQSAPLWGLGRVVSLEYPDLLCRRVDLDPSSQFSEAIPMLESELLYSNREDQIAYRQGLRYVSRLVRQKQHQSKEKGKLQMPVGEPFQLKLSAYGLLDNLNWQPMQRLGPKPNEVEIQVKAVGLNFRDVLNALGLLQDYYAQELGITSAEQLTFGFECAGIISQVGEQVTQWQVGDEVMAALIPNGFSSFVTVPAELVMLKPQQISFEEAATLPLTFLTASYGLHELAKIKPAEKVLIHAAAGGVGQAAVQIAQQVGAEVFATASPPKWKFLHSLGIKQVMNSRTLDFAEEIMNLTQGEGVDIVFNSLNGEFIDKSFEILTPRGRFVEIGKIGIWSQEQVQQKRPDVSYFPFDLGEVARENTRILVRGARKLEKEWEQGNLKPLPYKVFAKEEVIDAFRYMQQAKHIGKVVVSMTELSQEKETEISIQPEASYLITGGVGALGLEVAQWLVGQGARHLILTGRRKPSQTAQQKVEELEKLGAKISVLWGDISQQEDIVKIFEQIQGSGTELKGIIHAAGVLDDGVLQQISWERFTKVMAPKVQGSWHLHQLTQHLDLDFFVCFSSIAALLGSPGQGNYAAANAFMDALAHYRRGMGLPALTINWGPWAQAGMVARLEKSSSRQFMLQGIELIVPEQGLKVLKILLAQKTSQVAVLPISWPKFFEGVSPAINSPLLEELGSVSQQSKEKASEFLASLKTGDPSDRHFLILSYIKSKVSKALGIDSNQLDIQQPLNNMGLDSLMALELRNIIFTELQVEIAIEKFLENSSIAQLSELLLEKLTWESLMVQEPLSEDLEEDMEEFTL
jgi:myxalamid-type polyketide synthase MxaB